MMNSLIRSLSFPVVWSMNRAATKRGFRGTAQRVRICANACMGKSPAVPFAVVLPAV